MIDRLFRPFTFGRSGAEFLEDLLVEYGFEQLCSNRIITDEYILQLIIDDLKTKPVTVFITYRNDWWEWLVSVKAAAVLGGWVHYDTMDKIDWDTVVPQPITRLFIERELGIVENKWNIWLDMRTQLPNHNFYLLEMGDMIRTFSDYANHKRIPYNKNSLVTDYVKTKAMFDREFKHRFELVAAKAKQQLIELGVTATLQKEELGIT